MTGQSRSKNGVASLAYVPIISIQLAGLATAIEIAGSSPAMTT